MVKFKQLLDRFGNSTFPPAAALGALVSFMGTAFRPRAEPVSSAMAGTPKVGISFIQKVQADMLPEFEREYSQVLMLEANHSGRLFQKSLQGIALDSEDQIFVLGDGLVKVFGTDGAAVESWKAPEGAQCLTIDPGGHIYFGMVGHVEIYDLNGKRIGGFTSGSNNQPAKITAVKILGDDIFIADAAARIVRRHNADGKQIGEIGSYGKIRGFMLPNGSMDIGIDAQKTLYVSDPGRHRVTSWHVDGTPVGKFGKFGHANPEDFVGCCNPVNLAIAPDGCIVTAEKVAARVKVYSPKGKLQAFIGPEHFDLRCIHLHLAVDSRNRILVGDPVRLGIKIFAPVHKKGGDRVL
jgi:hypothetical protein